MVVSRSTNEGDLPSLGLLRQFSGLLRQIAGSGTLGVLVVAMLIFIIGCGGGEGGEEGGDLIPNVPYGDGGVVVDSPQAMSDAIDIEGAMRYSAALSAPNDGTAGSLIISAAELVVTQGSAFPFSFTPTIASDRRLDAIVIQVDGARETFVIPVSQPLSAPLVADDAPDVAYEFGSPVSFTAAPMVQTSLTPSGTISSSTSRFIAPVTARGFTSIQSDAPFPDLSAMFQRMQQQPAPASWTSPVAFQLKAQSVAVGDPQVSLTWDGPGDVDLWVIEPDGTRIGFSNRTSATTGGRLDTDNVVGFGPENIAWETPPPAGVYTVEVHYYSGSASRRFSVTVTNGGQRTTYTGTLTQSGERQTVTTFTFGSGSGGGAGGTGDKTGNAIAVVEQTGLTDAGGAPFTGITVFTSTSVGHFGGAFGIYVTIDGDPAPLGSSTLTVRANRRPTACTPNRVEYHAVHFAVQPGARLVEARLQGNPTFGWPEIRWSRLVHISAGECVMVNLGN